MHNGKKVFLVIGTGYFGDTLLTAKLTRDIKKNYPDSLLLFMVDTPYVDVAKGLPGIDEVIPYSRKESQSLIPFLKFIIDFPYKFKIDVAFVAQRQKKSRNILARLLGAKKLVTLNDFSCTKTCKKFREKAYLHRKYTSHLANMLSCLTGKETDNQDIEYSVPDFAQEKMDKCLEQLNYNDNLIAINPQASSDWKCWDINEVIKFVKMLIKNDKKIVLTGVISDGPQYVEAFNSQIGVENYLNMVSQTTIPELGALYKRCEAVVSVDTGSMHLACAVGARTTALFFRDDSTYWGPVNMEQNSYIYNPDGISAESVYAEVEKHMAASRA